MERFFIVLAYIWCVFVNLIQLLVVMIIFSKLSQGFEVIVISTLGFIYLTIRTIAFGQIFTNLAFTKALDHEFVHLRRLLGDESIQQHVEAASATLKTTDRPLKKLKIDMAFLAIIWIICLYQLVVNG